jgi:hypothetical protein
MLNHRRLEWYRWIGQAGYYTKKTRTLVRKRSKLKVMSTMVQRCIHADNQRDHLIRHDDEAPVRSWNGAVSDMHIPSDGHWGRCLDLMRIGSDETRYRNPSSSRLPQRRMELSAPAPATLMEFLWLFMKKPGQTIKKPECLSSVSL